MRDEQTSTDGENGKVFRWLSRRSFFDNVFRFVVGLWGFAFVGVVLSYLKAPAGSIAFEEKASRVGPLDELAPGEGKLVRHQLEPFWVVRTGSDQVVALPATCTHLRCILQWDKDLGRFVCPCHAGAFDLNGNVVAGPPPRPLQPLKVEIKGGVIYVDLS